VTEAAREVRVERRGAVQVLTLDRPGKRNAWTPKLGHELYSAIRDADADDAVRAIVVTGAGGTFCAGADLSGGSPFGREGAWDEYRALERAVLPWNLGTPVIAAIDGAAVGVGATVPLLFDVRLASDRARIGFVFTRRGITPEANSTWILPRLVGASRALELLISGRILDATEALAYGLVSRVVPHASLLDEAIALGSEIAEHTAPVAVAATKRLLWRQLSESDPTAAKAREDEMFAWIGKHPDCAEGVQAFLEKRKPSWRGRRRDLPEE
jgi:enoyl-CoA hydratase/carnithine racemase